MGKTSMTLSTKGFEALLERIQKAGGDINSAAERALTESAEPFYADLKAGIKKHHQTGLTEKSLYDPTKPVWFGDKVMLKVGFDLSHGGLPALFIEYGTPKQKPDPFIKLAIERNQRLSKKIQKKILTEVLEDLEK